MSQRCTLGVLLLSLLPLVGCRSAHVQSLAHGRISQEGAVQIDERAEATRTETALRHSLQEDEEERTTRHEEWLLEEWGDSTLRSGYRAMRLVHASARVAQSVRGEHLRSDTLRERGRADLGQALRATSSEAETREEKRRPSMGWIGGRTLWVIALISVLSLGLVCWSRGWRLCWRLRRWARA